jgi:hypothetical protein
VGDTVSDAPRADLICGTRRSEIDGKGGYGPCRTTPRWLMRPPGVRTSSNRIVRAFLAHGAAKFLVRTGGKTSWRLPQTSMEEVIITGRLRAGPGRLWLISFLRRGPLSNSRPPENFAPRHKPDAYKFDKPGTSL